MKCLLLLACVFILLALPASASTSAGNGTASSRTPVLLFDPPGEPARCLLQEERKDYAHVTIPGARLACSQHLGERRCRRRQC
jgi:hypothetical protein